MSNEEQPQIIADAINPDPEIRYAINEAYRRKHLDYMKVKVECPTCGQITARSNMTTHRRSKRHIQVTERIRLEKAKHLDLGKVQEAVLEAMKELKLI